MEPFGKIALVLSQEERRANGLGVYRNRTRKDMKTRDQNFHQAVRRSGK
jgi:hypothetical protein